MSEPKITLEFRNRFEGDTEPKFWQCDIYNLPDGENHHGVGETPSLAALRAVQHWHAYASRSKAVEPLDGVVR